MRFLQTADWHIGKELGDYSLLEQQKTAFEEMLKVAEERQVDAVIIAGDLYDRSIASTQAVNVLESMLRELNLTAKLPIFAVSGNHDGATRLGAGREWREYNHLYLATTLAQAFEPVTLGDVQVFMLPFIDPLAARVYYQVDQTDHSMQTIGQVMERVVPDMVAQFDPNKKHLLVTHYYVTGQGNGDYDFTSETNSRVGGLRGLDARQFTAFDYVALGHLHLQQASPNAKMQYPGSPIKFNTKEAQTTKGVFIVDLDAQGLRTEFVPLHPKKDLILVEGSYAQVTSPTVYQRYARGGANLFSIKLTDYPKGRQIRQTLTSIYGDLVEVQYPPREVTQLSATQLTGKANEQNPQTMIADFYKAVMKKPLTKQQAAITEKTLTRLQAEEEG